MFYAIKLSFVMLTKLRPKSGIFLNHRRNNFIGLGKVVIQVDMFKTLRYSPPTIDLLLG